MQIAYLKSTGKVYAIGDAVAINTDKISSGGGQYPRDLPYGAIADFSANASLFDVATVAGSPPTHFRPGFSHEYVGGTFQQVAGYTPPQPPVTDPWAGKPAMEVGRFPGFVTAILGPSKYDAIRKSPKTSWIWDTIMSPTQTHVNPNDAPGVFKMVIAFLRGQVAYGGVTLASPGDDDIMLTANQVTAMIAAWK